MVQAREEAIREVNRKIERWSKVSWNAGTEPKIKNGIFSFSFATEEKTSLKIETAIQAETIRIEYKNYLNSLQAGDTVIIDFAGFMEKQVKKIYRKKDGDFSSFTAENGIKYNAYIVTFKGLAAFDINGLRFWATTPCKEEIKKTIEKYHKGEK